MICDPVSTLHVTLKLRARKGPGWRFLSCGSQRAGELTVPAACWLSSWTSVERNRAKGRRRDEINSKSRNHGQLLQEGQYPYSSEDLLKRGTNAFSVWFSMYCKLPRGCYTMTQRISAREAVSLLRCGAHRRKAGKHL